MKAKRRKTSEPVAIRNKELLSLIESVKCDHPFWGYRRVWATVRFKHGFKVNHKRIYRLMRLHGLTIAKDKGAKATRTQRPKPVPQRPNQIWGIDMTKIVTGKGYAYLVIVLDWHTKRIVGHHIGERSLSSDWLHALDSGLNAMFLYGARGAGLKLISDNGCQPTSKSFMESCHTLGIVQIFTSYSNPKGNADTERMMRTIKEELVWTNEWDNQEEFGKAFSIWVDAYNSSYLHSSLGYLSPCRFELQEMERVAKATQGRTAQQMEEIKASQLGVA